MGSNVRPPSRRVIVSSQMTRTGVILPIRAFALGKARLADRLTPALRAELGRRWADSVHAAAGELLTIVVSSDDAVREWASSHRLEIIDDPGTLDAAAAAGREVLAKLGCVRVVVAHADLP